MVFMRFALRLGVVALVFGMTSLSAAAGTRVALVIGNSAYQNTNPLRNPSHDAADMAAVLKGLGFQTIVGLDLDKAAMDRKIRDFAQALNGSKVGLFFYAGHGLQVSGQNYLVPIDAKLETASALEFEAVPLQLVQRVMERSTETNVLFLDACRDNPLARNLARAMGTRSSAISRGLAPIESGVGTLISFSTQPGNVALDGAGRNSPFAEALVGELTASKDDLSTVLIHVRNQVMASTGNRQVPWEHSALRARLYFHGAPASGPAAASKRTLGEVAQAWSATKDSESQAVFRAFIAKYDGTVYGELARARLKELQEEEARRVTAPAPGSRPHTSDAAVPTSEHPFDGNWHVAVHGGKHCPIKSGGFPLVIKKSVVVSFDGKVDADGAISYDKPAAVNRAVKLRFSGKVSADKGNGTYRASGGRRCTGKWEMTRQGSAAALGQTPAAQGASPYDGGWQVALTATSRCPFKTFNFPISIDGGRITPPQGEPGRVDEQGRFEFHTPGKVRSVTVRHSGQLAANSGKGAFRAIGGPCRGTSVLKKLGASAAN